MTSPTQMKSRAERIAFVICYIIIAVLSLIGSGIHINPFIGLIIFTGSLIVWYFILKGIFWVVRKLRNK